MENRIESKIPQRDISTVTAEIKDICAQAQRMMLVYAIEIGRRLAEAKDMLPHGAWGEWLKNEVHFSQSTANKHMKIYEAYGSKQISLFGAELNSETFTNLNYSQALKLLAVPDEEREDFVKDNDIENKSVREIDRLIKERDAAIERAQTAEAKDEQHTELIGSLESELEGLRSDIEEKENCVAGLKNGITDLQTKLDKAKAAEKKAKEKADKYKAAAENPEIPQDRIDELKAEAETAAKKTATDEAKQIIEAELAEMRKKLAEAEQAEAEARAKADAAELKNKTLQQKLSMADPTVTRFKTIFEQTQDNLNMMIDIINKSDTAVKDKLKTAYLALFDRSREIM